jgi:hypothetical protein
VAAWLTRRWTTATLRALAESFGLSHPGSVSNLLRRAERAVAESTRLRHAIDAIQNRLEKTKNEICPGSAPMPAAPMPARLGRGRESARRIRAGAQAVCADGMTQ